MLENYHTHTARCQHATGTDREYIEEAIKGGFQVLGFADHCPWIYPDGYVSHIRMTPAQTDEYFYSLQSLRDEYKNDIKIYIGFEAEYLPSLIETQDIFLKDYPVDYMILGQHFLEQENKSIYVGAAFDNNKYLRRYVDLCIEGMRSGRYRYLAHPDLPFFTGDDTEYEQQMQRLCQAMKELSKPIEFNILGLASSRNYPDKRFWRIAKSVGNEIVFGIDAHNPKQLSDKKMFAHARTLVDKL